MKYFKIRFKILNKNQVGILSVLATSKHAARKYVRILNANPNIVVHNLNAVKPFDISPGVLVVRRTGVYGISLKGE